MNHLFREMQKGVDRGIEKDGRWLIAETGIVAENVDPDLQHRVKVIIPSIDEDLVFDEWAKQLVLSCLGDGFGAVWVPPVGSEVVLFGQLGQKYNLFYMSVYNEEMRVPEGYDNEMSVGAHVPGNLAYRAEEIGIFSAREINFHADELARTEAENIESEATALHKTTGENVESTAQQENKITGQTVRILGNAFQFNPDGSLTIALPSSSVAESTSTDLTSGTYRRICSPTM